MKTLARLLCAGAIVGLAFTAVAGKGKGHTKLRIQHDRASGKVVISWDDAKGSDLAQSRNVNGQYHRLRHTSSPVVMDTLEDQSHFQLVGGAGSIHSINVVGYVNTQFPPGLSLKANPLVAVEPPPSLNQNNTLGYLFQTAPDGAQVYKFTEGSAYEVSTFDAVTTTWSNPGIDLSVGVGFFFYNPSETNFPVTFVGEVLQGWLTNNLPAGFSTKGSLVPQAGSINTLHGIPGEPGDTLRLYVNDLQTVGYIVSTFDSGSNSWLPDLQLGVAEGFWMHKTNPQDWVRYFNIFE